MDNSLTPSDLIAGRIRQLRKARGMTVAGLAAACAEAGAPALTAQVLYKLEGQRSKRTPRPVTVDEMLVLAFVLDIAPVHLIAGLDDDVPLPVTPDWQVRAAGARQWIRGLAPLAGGDRKRYLANAPASEENTYFFVLQDVTDFDQAMAALDACRAMVSLRKWKAEHE